MTTEHFCQLPHVAYFCDESVQELHKDDGDYMLWVAAKNERAKDGSFVVTLFKCSTDIVSVQLLNDGVDAVDIRKGRFWYGDGWVTSSRILSQISAQRNWRKTWRCLAPVDVRPSRDHSGFINARMWAGGDKVLQGEDVYAFLLETVLTRTKYPHGTPHCVRKLSSPPGLLPTRRERPEKRRRSIGQVDGRDDAVLSSPTTPPRPVTQLTHTLEGVSTMRPAITGALPDATDIDSALSEVARCLQTLGGSRYDRMPTEAIVCMLKPLTLPFRASVQAQ